MTLIVNTANQYILYSELVGGTGFYIPVKNILLRYTNTSSAIDISEINLCSVLMEQ